MRPLGSFILFLAVFLTLYGLLHVHFYWKVTHAFALTAPQKIALGAFLLFQISAPVLVDLFTRLTRIGGAMVVAHAAYLWMGALFLFLVVYLMLDAADGLIRICSKSLLPSLSEIRPSERLLFVTACIIVLGIMVYGCLEAASIRTEKFTLTTGKLPPSVRTFRIAQISDLHLGLINSDRLARKVIEAVERIRPDLLVSTGDLLDRGIIGNDSVAELLSTLYAPFGKYAVTGNHEFYAGIEEAVRFTRAAGFEVLRNEGRTVSGLINLAGVDDPAGEGSGILPHPSEEEILERLPREKLTVLLKHQPRISQKSLGRFDLQLSGHTHDGQIFPFSWVVRLFYPFRQGLYLPDPNSYLYVSRGTGTWGPPVRFMSPPEVTVVELQRADDIKEEAIGGNRKGAER